MILDERLEFADALALDTGAAAAHLLGDVVDLSVARNIGLGLPLYLVIQVDTLVESAGAATVQFQLASDAQAAIATDGSATIHGETIAIPKATLVAGYQKLIPLPREGDTPYERFIGVLYTVGTAALTAGKVNAFITAAPPAWKAIDDGQISVQ